jgi:quercetin dioxygenase-like cupin family protein
MAYPGKEIRHPVAGERAVFRQTAASTNGELLQQDVYMSVGGFVTLEHVHRYQTERFQVKEGTGKVKINGVVKTMNVGDDFTVPPGVKHIWWNAGDTPLHALVEFRPALKIENLFETVTGLAVDGKVDQKTGLPNFLQEAVLCHKYFRELNPVWKGVPIWAMRILFAVLTPVGRVFGYKAVYPQYID